MQPVEGQVGGTLLRKIPDPVERSNATMLSTAPTLESIETVPPNRSNQGTISARGFDEATSKAE
jgi:hypothetical protein